MAGQIIKIVAVAGVLILVLPLLLAAIFSVSFSDTMVLVGSTFALEYLAIPLGVGLKLPPGHVFLTVVSVGTGIFGLALGIFQLLGGRSQRVVNFLLKLRARTGRLRKYGIFGLIPGAVFFGLYGCAALVWSLGWNVRQSAILFTIGLAAIAAILLFSSIGVFSLFGL